MPMSTITRSRLKMIFISMSLVFSSVTHAAELSNGLPSSVMSGSAIRDSNMQACAERLHFDSVQDYIHYLDTHNIDMDSITENGVPALYCKDLPLDMKKISGDTKKNTFIMIMLPVIKKINQQIEDDRSQLISLHAKQERGAPLSPEQKLWLENLADQYDVSSGNYRELLQRVNTIPASLVLAQSIQESGWGTSYTARAGNALFGQHRSPGNQNYTVTVDRGRVHLAGYDTIHNAVSAYIHNLNINPAYKHLRQIRADLQARGEPLSGYQLAQGLVHYSTRGKYYIRDLHHLIRGADLEQYDDISLADNPPVTVSFQDA